MAGVWLRLGLRDLVLLAAFGALWWWTAPWSAGEDFVADFFGLAAGLGIGIGHYLLHEWGHALGGLATGSVKETVPWEEKGLGQADNCKPAGRSIAGAGWITFRRGEGSIG